MYTCYICDDRMPTVAMLRTHLNIHSSIGELTLPVKCNQKSCKSSFTKISSFIRHIAHFHAQDAEEDPSQFASSLSRHSDIIMNTSTTGTVYQKHSLSLGSDSGNNTTLCDVQSEGVSLVAALRAKGTIAYNAVAEVVQSFNRMSSAMVAQAERTSVSALVAAGVDENTISIVKATLQQTMQDFQQPLNFLSSTYKQDAFFDNHPLAVKPQTVDFSPRYETSNGDTSLVYDSFQYVSVEDTLRSLLQNENYVRVMFSDKCKPGVLCDFRDGQTCANHYLFSDNSKLSIMLQIFYDGMGTTNPLRGQSVLCNVGVFYFVVKNLPESFNSCYANVHLLALCYSADLKTYGFDAILAKFVAEMNHLSTAGFCGTFPIIGTKQIYVSLCQVACDNLALNSMFGFIESFSTDYFCTLCLCTQDDIQHKFHERDFKLRTAAEYEKDINELPSVHAKNKVHSRGVKNKCLLNDITGFHVTSNYGLDPMHIILEGTAPLEIGCVLYSLCIVEKFFTIAMLNVRIHWFWSVINVERCNKPPELYCPEQGKRIKPSMKAIQCWSLLKYLPLLVGDLVPADNPHWLFLLDLCHLTDLVFAPIFTPGMADYLRCVIAEHLAVMKDLYGDVCSLKPKHHLMVHFPTVILRSGPLVGMSCMRYELKNSFFKRCAHSMYCFKNVCKTLAYRHQQHALYAKLSGSNIRDYVTVQAQSVDPVFTLPFADVLVSHFNIEPTDSIYLSKKAKRATVDYSQGQHVIIDMQENAFPVIGVIEAFVCSQSADKWVLVVQQLTTCGFVSHYHSYLVQQTSSPSFKIVAFEDLIDLHVVCAYKKMEQTFVRLQYHVVKTE